MAKPSSQSAECTLCGQRLSTDIVCDAEDNPFCSRGCRRVCVTLGTDTSGEHEGCDSKSEVKGRKQQTLEDHDRLFLRIDGMHSATCEAFLESRAERCGRVIDTEASYVTETIRVDYDPDRLSQSTLCETLSTLGYTAIPREEVAIDSNAATEHGDRQLDSVLGYRYAIGLLFGSFLMLPYIVMFYPTHLSRLFDGRILSSFVGASGFDAEKGILILPLFLVLTDVILFFTGMPLLRGAYVSLKMRQPNTEVLTSLTVSGAYLYSTVAMARGRLDVYFDLTIVITATVVAAIFYESLTKQRAMDRLTELTISQIDEARRYQPDGTTRMVPVDKLETGDRILVRQGERIPTDGVLATGACTVDKAVITGESLPITKREGDDVVGGSIVTEDAAVVRVVDDAGSSIDRLITTVWDLQSSDHGVQRQANRVATRIVPAVGATALLVGGIRLGLDGNAVVALQDVLIVLLVVSPWALGLATPLSVATNIEEALRRGIVVFDETIFERMRDIDVVVFDKTGTLTTGQMSVVEADAPAELLAAAGTLERRASHPAAEAIAAAFARRDETENLALSDGGPDESNVGDPSTE